MAEKSGHGSILRSEALKKVSFNFLGISLAFLSILYDTAKHRHYSFDSINCVQTKKKEENTRIKCNSLFIYRQ